MQTYDWMAYYLKDGDLKCLKNYHRSRSPKQKNKCIPTCDKGKRYNPHKDACVTPVSRPKRTPDTWTKLGKNKWNGRWKVSRSLDRRCPPHTKRVRNSKGKKVPYCKSKLPKEDFKILQHSGKLFYPKKSKSCQRGFYPSPNGKFCFEDRSKKKKKKSKK